MADFNETHDKDLSSPEAQESSDDSARYYGSVKEVVDRYTHCQVCGGHLHFTYVTDYGRNITQETSKCPECADQARRVTHRLQ